MTAELLIAWLSTYLVHSTGLLFLAWALDRCLRYQRRTALLESIWRTALLVPLLTATIQVFFEFSPAAPTVEVGVAGSVAADSIRHLGTTGAPAGFDFTATEQSPARPTDWPRILTIAWILGATAGIARLTGAVRALRRLMRGRTFRPAGRRARRIALAMGLDEPPYFSTSPKFREPFATGVMNPEVCLPLRLVRDLLPAQVDAVVAHETAHIVRHDPVWRFGCRLLQALLFLQPLNLFAIRRLDEAAEVLCDDAAAEITGDRRSLASSLVDVAAWSVEDQSTILAAAAARGPATVRRVRRLLDGRKEIPTMFRHTILIAITGTIAAILLLPGFSVADPPPTSPEAETERAPTPAPQPPAAPEADAEPAAPAPPAPVEPTEQLAADLKDHARALAKIRETRRELERSDEVGTEQLAELEQFEAQHRAAIEELHARTREAVAHKRALAEEARERQHALQAAQRRDIEARRQFEAQQAEFEAQGRATESRLRRQREALERQRSELAAQEEALRQRELALEERERELARRKTD